MNILRRLRKTKPSDSSNRLFSPSDSRIQARSEKLLQELVDIDSVTSDTVGVNRVQEVIARELEAMGFDLLFKPNTDVASGDLLIATLKGENEHDYFTFVSHADVVLGIDAVGSYRKLPDDLHARGPGVIDNKGGVTVALEGLRRFLESHRLSGSRPRFSLRFVCSPNEEAGSPGFQDEFRNFSKDSKLVLGFEPALDDGSIIESRRGNRWYDVTIQGKEAHAGRCKGEELNAAHDAALKISALHKLNNHKAGLSVNVGQITGGRDRFNVVCGEVRIKLDARFSTFESREKLHRQIEDILLSPEVTSSVTSDATKTTYSIADDCPPFSATTRSRSLLKFYLRRIEEIEGRAIAAARAGGAGDVNYMSSQGVMVLDGLGPVGGKMHTTEEFIYLPSLSTRAMALALFLKQAERVSNR